MWVCVLYVNIFNIFKHLLLWKHWAYWSQISYKNCIRLQRDCLETCNKCLKWQDVPLERYFFKLVENEQSDKRFLLTSKFCPLGLFAPDLGLYACIKYGKKWYKIRLQRDFFKLATKDRSDKMFLVTFKFRPQGVVSPCPWAIRMYTIMKIF